jgi:predicted N-acetyltransferase YhbS
MIRKAENNDTPAIKALMQSEPGFWQEVWREDVIERGIASSGELAFVWEDAGHILGFACAHDLGFRAYLSELIVSQQIQGQGVGKELIERIHHELKARGCAVLISDIWRDAEEFYRKLGWEEPDVKLMCKRLKL